MTTSTMAHRRRQRAITNPTFLQVALSPYRRDDPERYIMINIRTIQKVTPPYQVRLINTAMRETIEVKVPDPRYTVTFTVGHGLQEYGHATRADLVAVSIPIPPGWS